MRPLLMKRLFANVSCLGVLPLPLTGKEAARPVVRLTDLRRTKKTVRRRKDGMKCDHIDLHQWSAGVHEEIGRYQIFRAGVDLIALQRSGCHEEMEQGVNSCRVAFTASSSRSFQ